MARRRTFKAHFFNRGKWWVAWTADVPGAVTQGRTLAEARENLKDAIELMLEPLPASPKGRAATRHICETISV